MSHMMRRTKLSVALTIAAIVMASGVEPATADYADLVLSLDPVAYWRFNDPISAHGAVAFDSSSTGAHSGLYRNGVALTTADLPGPGSGGQAASFDGQDDSVGDITDQDFPAGDADRTLLTWFKFDPAALPYGYPSFFLYGQLTGTNAFGAGPYNANEVGVHRVPNGGVGVSQYGASVGTDPVLDGEWHFVAFTVTNSNYRVYLDGQFVRERAMATDTLLTGEAVISVASHISGPSGGTWPYPGLVDEMALFATALSDDDIAALHAEMLIPEPAALALLGLGVPAIIRRRGQHAFP